MKNPHTSLVSHDISEVVLKKSVLNVEGVGKTCVLNLVVLTPNGEEALNINLFSPHSENPTPIKIRKKRV